MELQRNILLVDDDPFLRNLLSEELATHGYMVETAKNGIEALNIVASNQVGAVITDIFMPNMDGLELILALRKANPGVFIIALSGVKRSLDKENYLSTARAFGANEVLTKPVELEILCTKLKAHFQHDDG